MWIKQAGGPRNISRCVWTEPAKWGVTSVTPMNLSAPRRFPLRPSFPHGKCPTLTVAHVRCLACRFSRKFYRKGVYPRLLVLHTTRSYKTRWTSNTNKINKRSYCMFVFFTLFAVMTQFCRTIWAWKRQQYPHQPQSNSTSCFLFLIFPQRYIVKINKNSLVICKQKKKKYVWKLFSFSLICYGV